MMKLFTVFFLVLTVLSGQGCAHKLNLDPSPPSALSGYPSAEFWVQGRLAHGLAEVVLRKGDSLNAIALEVQGYFSGTIRVDSGYCHLKKSINYSDMDLVPFELSGKAESSCLINILVSSVYPGSYDASALVYELKGQLLVKVMASDKPVFVASTIVQARSDAGLAVPYDGAFGSVKATFRGCDQDYQDTLGVTDGYVIIRSKALLRDMYTDQCTYEGYLNGVSGILRVSWNIWVYAREFSPLPLPKLLIDGRYLMVTADPTVAAVILDDRYELGNTARFTWDTGTPHTLRVLTVKGRSTVCRWDLFGSEWTCYQ
ncbi:MAG: hypothetical protein MUP21_02065 [Dehalococcoidia bacterium]|nr:hypothetical protein [Dehalococcoidia bacterium]